MGTIWSEVIFFFMVNLRLLFEDSLEMFPNISFLSLSISLSCFLLFIMKDFIRCFSLSNSLMSSVLFFNIFTFSLSSSLEAFLLRRNVLVEALLWSNRSSCWLLDGKKSTPLSFLTRENIFRFWGNFLHMRFILYRGQMSYWMIN